MLRAVAASIAALTLFAQAGCRPRAPRSVARTVYVRLPALLPLHPAWQDVKRLDALVAQADRLATPAAQASVPLPAMALPAPLPPSAFLPPRSAAAEALVAPALARVEAERTRFQQTNERVLRRERQAADQAMEADVAAHRAQLTADEPAAEAAATSDLDRQIRAIQLKVLAAESQLRPPIGGGPREETRQRLTKYQAQIAALEAQRPARIAAVRAKTEKAVADYRAAAERSLAQRMDRRAAELASAAEQRIAQYRSEVQRSLPTLSVAAIEQTIGGASVPALRIAPPSQVAAQTAPAAAQALAGPTAAAVTSVTGQRTRLVAFITSDVERIAADLAARNHWIISYSSSHGAPDVTADVTAALKQAYSH